MHRRIRVSLTLATVLAVYAAGNVAAATSAQINESFTVNSTLAITVDTSSFNYGALTPGASPVSQQEANVTVSGNSAFAVSISGTAFAGPGAASLPASIRQVQGATSSGVTFTSGADTWHAVNSIPTLATGAQPSTPATFKLQSRIDLSGQSNATAGAYTGSITLTVSPN